MTGLRVRTVTGMEFEVYGAVTYKPEHNTYYCDGQSWPAEIVKEVLK